MDCSPRRSCCQRQVAGSKLLGSSLLGLKPMTGLEQVLLQDHKFFDSADWALSKQGVKTEQQQQQPAPSQLEPKLAPTGTAAPRRASHLGDEG